MHEIQRFEILFITLLVAMVGIAMTVIMVEFIKNLIFLFH